MAKQHFYARVPARVSMYNRSDGFDTFAHSEGLEREFVERELAAVYENKLNKNDMEAVRKGQMPLVYSQCVLRSGLLTQTCISYLPLDYTGERSAYLSHTLILSESEREMLRCSKKNALFNPELFITDINAFDLVSQGAAADRHYPEKEYVPGAVVDTKETVKQFGPDILKQFLCAILSVLCAKGKAVYFRLPCSDEEVSARALELICSVISVIPYHLRDKLPFVTYVTDPAQYSQAKLKGMSERCGDVPAMKGVFLDFRTGLVTGMPAEYVTAGAPIQFFYSLLEDPALRDEFLLFVDRAVKQMPNLEKMNLKTLSDLVFLFCGASGLFSQQAVLPNDNKVLDFLSIYEKYRSALSAEYRRNAYKCFARYPERHEAIPQKVFAKLSRLYPAEDSSAKRIAMNAVLELIHTDIMRDKLFTFIRNNYDNEDDQVRSAITADLCRVFYGGFLQTQILTFFSAHFAQEPEETRNAVFDRLMLTIRTEAVQPKILEFLTENYDNLSAQQKDLFYETFYEMLPECDGLAQTLVTFVNHQIEREDAARKNEVAERLAVVLEGDYRKKEHRLVMLLAGEAGFCNDVVIKLAFGKWQTRKLHADYLQLLSTKPIVEKTKMLSRVFELMPDMQADTLEKMHSEMGALYQSDANQANLYQWFEVLDLSASMPAAFAGSLKEQIIDPAICHSVFDVFKISYRTDGINLIRDYAAKTVMVWNCERYKVVSTYLEMLNAVHRADYSGAANRVGLLLRYQEILPDVAEHIGACVIDRKTQSAEETFCLEILQGCLKNRKAKLNEHYTAYSDVILQQYYADHAVKANAAKASQEAAAGAMKLLLNVCLPLCSENKTLDEILCHVDSELEETVRTFMSGYGKGAGKWLHTQLSLHDFDCGFSASIRKTVQENKSSILGKIFAKH